MKTYDVETVDQLLTAIGFGSDLVNRRVFGADRVPPNVTNPYITFQELDANPALTGDGGAWAHWAVTVQIELVQRHGPTYDALLRGKLLSELRGLYGTVRDQRFIVRVREMRRMPPQPGETTVRDVYTVMIALPESAL